MTEPKGIIFEATISEKALGKFLHHQILPAPRENGDQSQPAIVGDKVVHFLAKTLYQCENNTTGVFLLNYIDKKKRLFCAFMHKDGKEELITPFYEILKILSFYKESDTPDYAIITSLMPEVSEGYKILNNKVEEILSQNLKSDVISPLLDKFWSFMIDNDFPEPAKAFKKSNYYYKPFQKEYEKHIRLQEEIERPARIAKATKENPYYLFDSFYSYEYKVFDFSRKEAEISEADPLTFKKAGKIFLDKERVFARKLINKGLPVTMQNLTDPETHWEYFIIPGIDAASFTPVKERWDTLFWKDKHHVYIETTEVDYPFREIELADVATFEYLAFCFGKDKDHIFYKNEIIDIDPQCFHLDKHGFISDRNNIYHYENKINLDPATFTIISVESLQNPFLGTFILGDKNGSYEYEQNRGLKRLPS